MNVENPAQAMPESLTEDLATLVAETRRDAITDVMRTRAGAPLVDGAVCVVTAPLACAVGRPI